VHETHKSTTFLCFVMYKSLWHISIPKNCSWSWKKLLKLREVAKEFLRFKIREGRSISLSFDNWHPASRLLDTYGYQVVYDSGICLDAKVSVVIRNDNWAWPPTWSDELVEIQCKLSDIAIGGLDVPIWKSKNCVYSC
jgi:hypothetical protein